MYPNLLYQLANHLNLIQNSNNTNVFQSQIQALRTLAPQSNTMSSDSLNENISNIAQQVLNSSSGLNTNSQNAITTIWSPLTSGNLTDMNTSQITNLATTLATSMHSIVASSLVSQASTLMSSGCLGSPLTSMLGQVSQSWS
jgi:membrane-associated HD superfamily phosphohydrolase